MTASVAASPCLAIKEKQKRRRAAFSLMELVVVIGIMLVIAAISIPMFSGLTSSSQFNRAAMEISGLLESARQTAVTQNTYTWLAMGVKTAANGEKILHVAVLSSKDGSDPTPWGSYGTVPSDAIGIVTQTRFFKQVILSDAGTFGTAVVPTLPATPAVTAANSLSQGTASFTITTPQETVTYDRVVQFTASGEARNSANGTQVIEFALQPQRGNSAAGDDKNIAVFRISGITGQCQVYRR
ncbi:MAG: Tfp pilus assembly protein FimT/FimU [Candidatus Methylacidiphilales bacterium]